VSDAADTAANATTSAVEGVASALDPTGWFGSDDTEVADNSGASTDSKADTTPDLSNLPSRPATTPMAQQQAAAQSLAADGAQARYSADSLRAGNEASATPPPPTADIAPGQQLAMAAPSADAPPTTDMGAPPAAAAPPPRPAPAPMASAAPAPSAPPPSALTQGTAAVPVAGGVPMAAAAPMASASAAARPPGAQPAVPAVPANTPARGAAMGVQYASDAQLGFKPSEAPPLDASISQWVSQPVIARYRQTASNAGIAPVRMAAVPAVPARGMGGPEAMSGAVTANLDAVSVPGGAIAAMAGGMPATATVFFPGDGTTISAAARAQIRSAADQFKALGGAGTIRVVGHASSRTANMPVDRHLTTIFKKSQDRANAVAQELIRQGVPAVRVLIEAVGDSQPVYYESMPQGEEGNRRAEIFVQG